MRRGLSLLAIVTGSAMLLSGCEGDGETDGTLRVALWPDGPPATVIRNNEPFRARLEAALGRPVKLVVEPDFPAMIEAMRRGRIDVGSFGAISYVLLKQRVPGATAFAARLEGNSSDSRAVLIVGPDSGIKTVEDLKGKTVAFGELASVSSHLIPRSLLKMKGGLSARKDYKDLFVGSPGAVALKVQDGTAQAGGMSRSHFDALIEQGTIQPDRVTVLAESDPAPGDPWVARDGLDPTLQLAIRDAFLNLNDPAVLKMLHADGFAAVRDEDYDVIRDMVRLLGIDLEPISRREHERRSSPAPETAYRAGVQ